jgi:hypothetical protein
MSFFPHLLGCYIIWVFPHPATSSEFFLVPLHHMCFSSSRVFPHPSTLNVFFSSSRDAKMFFFDHAESNCKKPYLWDIFWQFSILWAIIWMVYCFAWHMWLKLLFTFPDSAHILIPWQLSKFKKNYFFFLDYQTSVQFFSSTVRKNNI